MTKQTIVKPKVLDISELFSAFTHLHIKNMSDELITIKLKVMQKLGCNVLLFQVVERQLKALTPLLDAKGIALNAQSVQKIQTIQGSKKTLGTLFGKFTDSLQINTEDVIDDSSTDVKVRHSIKLPLEVQEEWIAKLQALVDSRNEMVHHFLDNYKIDSIEDLSKAEKYLDEQQKDITLWIKTFSNISKTFAETAAESIKVMGSFSVVSQFVDLGGWNFEFTIPSDDNPAN